MKKLTNSELSEIIGSQSLSELNEQMQEDNTTVNFFACSNSNPCNSIDVLACTGTQPVVCR